MSTHRRRPMDKKLMRLTQQSRNITNGITMSDELMDVACLNTNDRSYQQLMIYISKLESKVNNLTNILTDEIILADYPELVIKYPELFNK